MSPSSTEGVLNPREEGGPHPLPATTPPQPSQEQPLSFARPGPGFLLVLYRLWLAGPRPFTGPGMGWGSFSSHAPLPTDTISWSSLANAGQIMASKCHHKGRVGTTGWMGGGCWEPLDTARQACRGTRPAACCSRCSCSSHPTSLLRPQLRGSAGPASPQLLTTDSASLTGDKHSRDEQKECTYRCVHITVL